MKTVKKIPKLKSEKDVIDFWDKNDSTDYIDYSLGKRVKFPNLKPSTKSISIRLPESMIENLKVIANKKDVPYQSLIKVYISDKIDEEIKKVG
jgi:predicted DNA binding CopG/RHH family protein